MHCVLITLLGLFIHLSLARSQNNLHKVTSTMLIRFYNRIVLYWVSSELSEFCFCDRRVHMREWTLFLISTYGSAWERYISLHLHSWSVINLLLWNQQRERNLQISATRSNWRKLKGVYAYPLVLSVIYTKFCSQDQSLLKVTEIVHSIGVKRTGCTVYYKCWSVYVNEGKRRLHDIHPVWSVPSWSQF